MGFLLRVGGLIGGVLLVVMTVGAGRLRPDRDDAYWMIVESSELQLLTGDGDYYGSLDETDIIYGEYISWSPDTQWIVHYYDQLGLRGVNVARPEREYHVAGGEDLGMPLFSPNGDWIIYQIYARYRFLVKARPDGSDSSYVVDYVDGINYYGWTDEGEVYYQLYGIDIDKPKLMPKNARSGGVTGRDLYRRLYSPDGANVLGHNRYGIYREVESGSAGGWIRITPEDFECDVESWLPTNWIICKGYGAERANKIYRFRPDGSEISLLIDDPTLQWVNWSENGEWIYYRSRTELIRVDVESGLAETIIDYSEGNNGWYQPPIWTNDHRWMVYGGGVDMRQSVYKIDTNSGRIERLYLLPEQTRIIESNNPYRASTNSEWIHINSYNPRNNSEVFHVRVRLSDNFVEELPNGRLWSLSPQFTMLEGDPTPLSWGSGLLLLSGGWMLVNSLRAARGYGI